MQGQAHHLFSFVRAIVLAAFTALLITPPPSWAQAQGSAPATAVQAARMPQYTSRLARNARPVHSQNVLPAGHLPPQGDVYDNGPVNGELDAWNINFGFAVTNSMASCCGEGLQFWAWLLPGDSITSVQVSIGSAPFGSDIFNAGVSVQPSYCFPNQYGYNVCMESGRIQALGRLLTGQQEYWLTLQDANTNNGDPVYWDQNNGAGCQSPGCPSQAEQEGVGTIPSESFSTVDCPFFEQRPATQAKAIERPRSPTQTFRVLYNFSGAGDGGYPVTSLSIDAAGNLYGTTLGGNAGTIFKLTPGASGWRYTRLYSFSGANGSGPQSPVAIAANGRLYGTTAGGGSGDGVLFGLAPPGHIPPSVFSNWTEAFLYGLTGSDGAGPSGNIVLDSSGDIYGTTGTGGAHSYGTLYEYTSSGFQVLHAFPESAGDGLTPGGVVSGPGGMYGFTTAGGQYGGGTAYTITGGYQTLQSFDPNDFGIPTSLAADQAGNLYVAGTTNSPACGSGGGTIAQLSPPNWNPLPLITFGGDTPATTSWISTDALGNVYGTAVGGLSGPGGTVFELTCCWSFIDLYDFTGGSDGNDPAAAPVVDPQGNIYGTTTYGGAYGAGVVWEISP